MRLTAAEWADNLWLVTILASSFAGALGICLIATGKLSPVHLAWTIPLVVPLPASVLLAGNTR